jgi:hypothetical protein
MLTTYATEYTGYLCSRFAGIDISALDMSATTEHFTSSGWDEPILSAGMKARYTLHEIDIPEWLVTGLSVNHDDVLPLAAQIASANYDECDLYRALRYLTNDSKPGKFYRSLIEWYTSHGTLSPKQVSAILNPPQWGRR